MKHYLGRIDYYNKLNMNELNTDTGEELEALKSNWWGLKEVEGILWEESGEAASYLPPKSPLQVIRIETAVTIARCLDPTSDFEGLTLGQKVTKAWDIIKGGRLI